ncbi:MAG: helix-turn-helix transcriptional regulator [Acidobacteriota bacterium]
MALPRRAGQAIIISGLPTASRHLWPECIWHRFLSRDAKGWSQERLAEAAYLDRSYLAGIERGLRNPSVRSLLKIANALRVKIHDLFAEG